MPLCALWSGRESAEVTERRHEINHPLAMCDYEPTAEEEAALLPYLRGAMAERTRSPGIRLQWLNGERDHCRFSTNHPASSVWAAMIHSFLLGRAGASA